MAITREQISEYLKTHEAEMFSDLFTLMRIDSSAGAPAEGMPYGPGPAAGLAAAAELCEKYGFPVTNYEGKMISAALGVNLPRELDMLVHADVVPGGDGWTVTEPFEPVIKDGVIYGRGCGDDKGGVISVLYAMRALKELGFQPKKQARILVGSSEECNMRDVLWYYENYPEAPFTFTADGGFPLVNVEKGRLEGYFEGDFAAPDSDRALLSFHGGAAHNQIPPAARCLLRGVTKEEAEAKFEEITAQTGVTFRAEETPEGLQLSAAGKSSHGSKPQLGRNSLSALLKLLLELDLHCESMEKLAKLYAFFPFGDYTGSKAGLEMQDPVTGDTTCGMNLLTVEGTHLQATIDSRTARPLDERDIPGEMTAIARECGMEFWAKEWRVSHVVPGDDPHIRQLLDCYTEVTGCPGETRSMGGLTYCHSLKRGVAFGILPADYPSRSHGPDESLPAEQIGIAALIFAMSILKICG